MTGASGVVLSLVEQTSLPMILYGVALAISEIYKYKSKKIKECSNDCKK